MTARAMRLVGTWVPIGFTFAILGLDILVDEKTQFVGLLAVVPMLAAVFVSPARTAFVGAVALSAAFVFGQFIASDGRSTAQAVRLVAILLFVVVAVIASAARSRQVQELGDVRDVAEAASRAILRPVAGVVGGRPVAVAYLSAHAAADIGGDLYEAIDTPHGTRFVVGDVRGKGLDAVRLASVALGTFREAARRDDDLTHVAAAMDAAVRDEAQDHEDFVTAVLAELHADGAVTLVCAGHPPPILVRDGRPEELTVDCAPPLGLGLGLDAAPPARTLMLTDSDAVLLYTDGVSEARRDGRFFPLLDAVADAFAHTGRVQDAVNRLVTHLVDYTGGALHDDVAMLAFAMSPPPADDHVGTTADASSDDTAGGDTADDDASAADAATADDHTARGGRTTAALPAEDSPARR